MDKSKESHFSTMSECYNVGVDTEDFSNAIELLLIQVICGKKIIYNRRDDVEYCREEINKLKDKLLRMELIGRGMQDMLYEKEYELCSKDL